ncbi:P-loop containing nucleoside triphosphate hydrolase protein [Scleroderma citrinum]
MSSGEQVIAVIGPIGAGKSSFIQNSLPPGLRHKVKVGHGFQPETKQVQPVNWVTEDGTRVKLLDTPGLDNSRSIMTDVKTLKMIATFLINEVQRKGSHLAGVIYIHQINDTGVGGNAQRNLRTFQQLCGNNSVMKVVIVTTMWDVVTSEKGSRLEQELSWSDSLFKPLLDEGAIMMRHDKPPESAMSAINHILGKKTIITQIVREPVQERKALEDSAAGTPHHSENRPLVQKHKEESKLLKAVMRGALQNIQGVSQHHN